MDDMRHKIANAAGITEDQYKRWSEVRTWEQRKGYEDDHIFYMEGPIVGSGMFDDDVKGFTTPAQLREFLKDNAGKDIEISINSPGGSVFEANAMLSDLMQHDGKITIRVTGAAFSAAADFLTLPNTHRIAMPGTMVMIHNAWTIAAGDSEQLTKVVARLKKMNKMCIDRFVEATEYDADELKQMMNDETFFTAEEAKDGGFVDEIFQVSEEEEAEDDEAESDEAAEDDARLAVARATEIVSHRLATIL